jgi:uncharacterized protein YaaR (DUF327 family)
MKNIFNNDDEDDFAPRNPSDKDKEERIKKFLQNINEDGGDELLVNRRSKRKLIYVVLKMGINEFIKSFPKIIYSEFYDTLMIDLYNHYTKSKFDDIEEIDIENIIHAVKYFEDDEEYEKCRDITKLYTDLEYKK